MIYECNDTEKNGVYLIKENSTKGSFHILTQKVRSCPQTKTHTYKHTQRGFYSIEALLLSQSLNQTDNAFSCLGNKQTSSVTFTNILEMILFHCMSLWQTSTLLLSKSY